MTTNSNDSRPEDTPASEPERRDPSRRRLLLWPLALVALTLGLMIAANTVSAWGRSGWHGPHDDEDFRERFRSHAEHAVDRMLDRLEASDDQREAIDGILATTLDRLAAERAERTPLRSELREWLVAETVDRDVLEATREAHLAHADRLSRIVADGIADTLEVLTPEQRRALEARLDERHRRGFRRHGHPFSNGG